MSPAIARRASALGLVLLLSLAMLVGCAVHARFARARAIGAAEATAGRAALGAQLPSPDVAFTGGARWLRALSLEEPGASRADGIAFPDPEPAGGALSAPRAAWAEESAAARP